MLFNSYVFLCAFLPITLAGFYLLGKRDAPRLSALWLIATSLFFYAWWNPRYLALLGISITANYFLGKAIDGARQGRTRASPKMLLWLGVTFDLGLLGYYKYTNFLVDTYNSVAQAHWAIAPIILPLAISFFTFTQIAYLVDAYHGETTSYDFWHYLLFVTFFPHLIAGPIVSYRRLGPQFARSSIFRLNLENLSAGLTLFALGLAKKVLIADNLAPLSQMVFDRAAPAGHVPQILAWMGALAYTFQIYFDFSGYSDMAIGLARMFNVQFPLNFDSPYKSKNIAEFWRRWHITLSTFLRDHLYIPLGGNRRGEARRYFNLMATMLLGGMWHGAGWNFAIWGGLHGFYLVVHRIWEKKTRGSAFLQRSFYLIAAQALTMAGIVLAWVFFRAHTLRQALDMLAGMAGLQGPGLPISLQLLFTRHGFNHPAWFMVWPTEGRVPFYLLTIIAVAALAFFPPNTEEILRLADVSMCRHEERTPRRLWRLSMPWAFTAGFLLAASMLQLTKLTEFLYFQF